MPAEALPRSFYQNIYRTVWRDRPREYAYPVEQWFWLSSAAPVSSDSCCGGEGAGSCHGPC